MSKEPKESQEPESVPVETAQGEEPTTEVEVTETSGAVVEQELPTLENFLERDYRMGEWNGIPNFGCPRCDFRTLQGNQEVAQHYFDAHLAREV